MSDLQEIEVEGATLEEAKLRAEGRLGALSEELEVTVLHEGKQGLFGLFSRPWRIRAQRKQNVVDSAAVDLLQAFFVALGIEVAPSVRRDEDHIFLDLEGDFEWLTRRRGEALDALQYLLSAAIGRHGGERIVLDAGGFRAARQRSLEKLAREAAQHVLESGEPTALESMPAAERRIVHSVIQEYPDLMTQSRGEEPHRQVVIQRR
ncbi:MAG: Jag N-terminal domain-containing protein [Thermaerobacter sp.]|nr:Jag N-terminal domain-containing protein [Thermaerobacter sp.]